MTRQPSDINPNDVFPPSDLPGAAQAWGRVVEDREIALEKGYIAHGQSLDGLNRTLKGNMANTAEQMTRLSEKVQTYRRVFLQSELVSDAVAGFPTKTLTEEFTAPSWATSGTVLTFTFPAWSGTVSVGHSCALYVYPASTWNGNWPLLGATASIMNDGGVGSPRRYIDASHSHPVEPVVDGVLEMDFGWTYTAGATYSGISLTLDTTILWN